MRFRRAAFECARLRRATRLLPASAVLAPIPNDLREHCSHLSEPSRSERAGRKLNSSASIGRRWPESHRATFTTDCTRARLEVGGDPSRLPRGGSRLRRSGAVRLWVRRALTPPGRLQARAPLHPGALDQVGVEELPEGGGGVRETGARLAPQRDPRLGSSSW